MKISLWLRVHVSLTENPGSVPNYTQGKSQPSTTLVPGSPIKNYN